MEYLACNVYLLIIVILFTVPGDMNGGAELKEGILCATGNRTSIECPENSFIDMLPGGDIHTPVSVFIHDCSCLKDLKNATCRVKNYDLVSECHGEQKCNLSPMQAIVNTSQESLSSTPEPGCQSPVTTAVIYYYVCLTMQAGLNYAMMVSNNQSKKRKRTFIATQGHILSPNFPNPVESEVQFTNCTLKFKKRSKVEFAIQKLTLRPWDRCTETLIIVVDGVQHRNFCSPHFGRDFFSVDNVHNITITFTKDTNSIGGKFWLRFTATREAHVVCWDISKPPSTETHDDVILGVAVGIPLCCTLVIIALIVCCFCFKRDKRKNNQEKKKADLFSILQRLSTRKCQRPSLYSDTESRPEYQNNPGQDIMAPKHVGEMTKKDTGTNSSPHEYSYAYIDERYMRNKVRRGFDGYDEVLEFKSNLDSPEKMTGSDTLMQENDVYSSSSSGPSSLQVGVDRTSQTLVEGNAELYEGNKHNNKQNDERFKQRAGEENNLVKTEPKIKTQPFLNAKQPLSLRNSETLMVENTDIYVVESSSVI